MVIEGKAFTRAFLDFVLCVYDIRTQGLQCRAVFFYIGLRAYGIVV